MKILVYLIGILLSFSVFALEGTDTFLEAKKAAAKGQWDRVDAYKRELLDHPLYPYLDYYYLRSNFTTVDDALIQRYLDTYPDSPMAYKLRKKWLYEFAEKKQWQHFLAVYQPTSNSSLECYYRTALHQTGNKAKAFENIETLWLSTKTQPDSCTSLMDHWLAASSEKEALIWKRFEMAMIEKKFDLAEKLVKKFSPENQKAAQQVLQLYKSPNMVVQKSFLDKKPIANVVSFGLWRLARINPQSGIEHWQRLREKYTFTLEQEQRIFQSIGLAMAMKKDAESTRWFRKLLGADLAPVYKDWMMRAAVIYEDWGLVIDSVNALPEAERNSLRWQYWYGRALQKLGRKEQANAVLSAVAEQRHYYGFLASYYLQQPMNVKHEVLNVTPEEVNVVKNLPGFQRATLLYQLKQMHDARVELYTLMQHTTEKQQYIITKLIADWGWYPQALRLSKYPDHQDDILLRFPVPYEDQVAANAKKYSVDPALIYAIMRQESYFMPEAKSPAGAVGLMQLMPDTAKRTAKKFSVGYNGKSDLTNSTKNITLGSAHINELKQEFSKHPALVIAAYNAGKNAVQRWFPKKAMPTDVWIETVPYYETRNYLRSVIANYIVYQHRLGMQPNLSDIMVQVPMKK